MMETTLETELNRIVYAKVARGEYPEPVAQVSDAEQRAELTGLKAGMIERPATKLEYINRLAQLEAQIKGIAAQNEQINSDNAAARKAVDDKFSSDIATAKLDEENLWDAVRGYRNYLLAQSDWTQLPDSPLTESKKAEWQENRRALRDITETFKNPSEVVFPTPPS